MVGRMRLVSDQSVIDAAMRAEGTVKRGRYILSQPAAGWISGCGKI
jgi:hypothetical protein